MKIDLPHHLFQWMLELPVLKSSAGKLIHEKDENTDEQQYEMNDQTAISIINGNIARKILNYMIKFKNSYNKNRSVKIIPKLVESSVRL